MTRDSIGMCLGDPNYKRRRAEESKLYQILSDNWETFLQRRSFEGRNVPMLVCSEVEGFVPPAVHEGWWRQRQTLSMGASLLFLFGSSW